MPNNVIPLIWTGTFEVVRLFIRCVKRSVLKIWKQERFERTFFNLGCFSPGANKWLTCAIHRGRSVAFHAELAPTCMWCAFNPAPQISWVHHPAILLLNQKCPKSEQINHRWILVKAACCFFFSVALLWTQPVVSQHWDQGFWVQVLFCAFDSSQTANTFFPTAVVALTPKGNARGRERMLNSVLVICRSLLKSSFLFKVL